MSMKISESAKHRTRVDLKIAVFIPVIVLGLYKLTNNYNLYHILIEFICSSMVLSIALISYTKKNTKISFFNYIGYGFPMIFLVNFFHAMYANSETSISNLFFNTMFAWICNNFLEYSLILLSILFLINNASKKTALIGFALTFIIMLVFSSSIFYIKNNYYYYSSYIIHCWYLLYILLITILVLTLKHKDLMKNKERKYLYVSLIFIAIYEFTAWIHFQFYYDTLVWAHIFKYVGYFVIYEALIESIIYETYSITHNKLLEAEKNQIVLNRTLQDRLSLLKEIRDILSKSEMKYTSLLESISHGIMIFRNNYISYANEASSYFLEGLLHSDTTISLTHVLHKLNINHKLNSSDSHNEIHIKRRIHGEEKDLEIYLFEIKENLKALIIKDVTGKIKNHKLKLDLERYLGEENLKNSFFSNISHELRTPINLIYSAIQLNDLYFEEGNYNSIEKNTNVIRQNCLRLIRTVNNFIDTSRLSEGYFVPSNEVYNIVELVEDAAQISVRYIDKVDMHMVFDSEDEEINVNCDGELIQRVVLNLLSNSVKFGKKEGYIYINIYHNDEKVFISIKNDGPSVSKDIEPFLFDKFSKVNKALNRDKEGSGLGLHLCRSLIEVQGGSLVLKTEEKLGNEFLITLPYEAEIHDKEPLILPKEYLDEKVDIEFSDIYT
ncbi:MAG: ATP-binding protein [Clostridiaceae bacterium]